MQWMLEADLKPYDKDIWIPAVNTLMESPSLSFANQETGSTTYLFKCHSC